MQREEPPPDTHASEPDANTDGSAPTEPAISLRTAVRKLYERMPWLVVISDRAKRHVTAGRALAVGIIVAGILTVFFASRSPSPNTPQQIAPDTRRFFVTKQPTLVFNHSIGTVQVMPGPDGQVSIKESKNGETDAVTTHYAQSGDVITVTTDISSGLMEDTWVDFQVSVPAHTGVGMKMATGTLYASNLSGPITLSDTNGSIWATKLAGTIRLKTQSGSINLTNVAGQVNAATQNGTITTTATHLSGHSSVQAESGTINFHGSLSQAGSYLFQNSNGAVGLTLPPNSAFALRARTATGSINTDFPGVSIAHESSRMEARGAVGGAPRAPLTIQTLGGSIGLFRGG